MSDLSTNRKELLALSSALESHKKVLEDLRAARQLPEQEIAAMLLERTDSSRARTDALRRRLVGLRQLAEVHLRTLRRLRARMHQMTGGARPH